MSGTRKEVSEVTHNALGERELPPNKSRDLRRLPRLGSLGRLVAVDVEPLRLELDPLALGDGQVAGERDHRVAQRDLRAAMRLMIGGRVADAPGPVLDLFGVAAADVGRRGRLGEGGVFAPPPVS